MSPKLSGFLLTALFISTPFAMAQTSSSTVVLDEILVTSGFRPATQHKTPASVTAISEKALETRQAQHLEDVLTLIPNVNSAKGSSRARFYQMRGVGERSQFVGHVNPSVGVLLDGIDMSSIAASATLMDIKQVEVLRGPQGTLYGSNALAGLINLQSNDPTTQPEASLEGTIGNYNTHSLTTIYSTPLTETAGLRLAISQNKSDGFMRNDHLNRKNTSNIDETFIRAKLRFAITDDLLMDLTGFYADINNGYDAFSLDNTRTTLSDEPGRDRQISKAFALKSIWTGHDVYQLETRLSHSNTRSDYGYDEDWAFNGFHPWGYSSYDEYVREYNTTTAELRFVSLPGQEIFNGTTQWTAGLHGFHQDSDLKRDVFRNGLPRAGRTITSDFKTERVSLYGELETLLSEDWILTSGLRVEHSRTAFDDNVRASYRKNEDLWGGRLALEHFLTPETSVYASLSKGYKVGGVNGGFTPVQLSNEQLIFDTESLWNYEIGSKGRYLDGRLITQTSLFYQQRKDAHLKGSFMASSNPADGFVDYLFNADQVNNTGAEFEFNYALDNGLSVQGALGLLQTKVKDARARTHQRDVAHAPHWQYQLGLAYDRGQGWFSGVSVEGKDSFYFSDSHDAKSWDYKLVNAYIGYQQNSWSVRLWGRNLGNKDIAERGFFFGNDPSIDYEERAYYQLGAPRTFGVTARLMF